MALEFSVVEEENHIFLEVKGEREIETHAQQSSEVWARTFDTCIQTGKLNVLGRFNISGELTLDNTELIFQNITPLIPRGLRVAVFDTNFVTRLDLMLPEMIAEEKRIHFKSFISEEKAREWLFG